MRKLLVGGAVALASVAGVAAPAFAHDCFNPTKNPDAGVHYTITSVDPTTGEPTGFTPTGQGKGVGGFVAFDPSLIGGQTGVQVHAFGGQSGPKDGTVGPGSDKAGAKGCDGKGIDYLDACFGAG
jgi:hypothetical protein